MALAKVTKKDVIAVEETVTLSLTKREAEVLHAITRRVGGSPKGARGCAESIREALHGVGISYAMDSASGDISFN
jgi:hypothetical protein